MARSIPTVKVANATTKQQFIINETDIPEWQAKGFELVPSAPAAAKRGNPTAKDFEDLIAAHEKALEISSEREHELAAVRSIVHADAVEGESTSTTVHRLLLELRDLRAKTEGGTPVGATGGYEAMTAPLVPGTQETATKLSRSELEALKLGALRELAEEMQLPIEGLTKAELVDSIIAAQV